MKLKDVENHSKIGLTIVKNTAPNWTTSIWLYKFTDDDYAVVEQSLYKDVKYSTDMKEYKTAWGALRAYKKLCEKKGMEPEFFIDIER